MIPIQWPSMAMVIQVSFLSCLYKLFFVFFFFIYKKFNLIFVNSHLFAFMLKMSSAGARKVVQTLPTLSEHINEASSYGVKK